jgi:hypothetical protein
MEGELDIGALALAAAAFAAILRGFILDQDRDLLPSQPFEALYC